MTTNRRTGGRLLVDQLILNGADLAFGVPGESYLAVLDALVDRPELRYITCRQEGGAAMMAEAYGKLTGRPGICLVTRGPGATNASAGVHVAFQDSTPLILLIGQVGRAMREREAFQEIDFRRMYGQMAKCVAEIDDAARIPEFIHRAYQTALNGRPGPVVLALPEDMLRDLTDAADGRPARAAPAHPGGADMAELGDRLARAARPFLLLGGGGWSESAVADIRAFAEGFDLPVGVSFRCQDTFDNTHPNYAGHVGIGIAPKLKALIQGSDLIVAVGARLGEITTGGYALLDLPRPAQSLIHVHPGPEELGRVFQADLAINAAVAPFAAAARALRAPADPPWSSRTRAAHAAWAEFARPLAVAGPVQPGEIVAWLADTLPPQAILCNGAGNYAIWLHRHYRYRRWRSQLAPTSGSMGYGTPAAVAAKLVHPDRPVVAFAGDGCFQMTMQEFGTAVGLGLGIVFIIVNNGMYGTIRMHQERTYPTRVSGTDLVNPDFAALARSYGAVGVTVTRTEDFAAAFAEGRAQAGPALIELRLDPEALTPAAGLSEIRAQALARVSK